MATKLSTLLGSSFTGTTGPAGTIEIGTVTTGAAGAPAVVTNSGTQRSAILNFTLPTGDGAAITAVNDTTTATLYPVMVGAAGSNTSPKVTTSKLSFNASTGTLSASNLSTTSLITSSVTGNVSLSTDAGGSISIGRTDNNASTPYIDFNSNTTTVDYDARIQVSGGNGSSGNGTLSITAGILQWNSQTVTTASNTQTLTNKTLTSPIISTISNTGTLTLPTSTDTLVGRATTDTLTNKTLTNPTISGAITFPNGSTQSAAGATTGKAIAMAIVFGG